MGKLQINGHVNRRVTNISTRVSINAGRRGEEQKKGLKENGEISK